MNGDSIAAKDGPIAFEQIDGGVPSSSELRLDPLRAPNSGRKIGCRSKAYRGVARPNFGTATDTFDAGANH